MTYRIVFPKMAQPKGALASILFATVGKSDTRKRMQLLKQRVESAGSQVSSS